MTWPKSHTQRVAASTLFITQTKALKLLTELPISTFIQDFGLWPLMLFSLLLAQQILPLGVFVNQLIGNLAFSLTPAVNLFE